MVLKGDVILLEICDCNVLATTEDVGDGGNCDDRVVNTTEDVGDGGNCDDRVVNMT